MSFVGRERWTQAKRLRAVRTVHAVGHDRLSAMPGKIAGGEAQPRNRSAEAGVARALKVEARLERKATQGGANRPASDLQRVGRQLRVAHRARSLDLNGAGDRPVGIDAALPARAFETGVVEHLANDKLTGLVGSHLAGYCRRQRGQQAGRQYNTTQHSPHSD